MFDYNKLVVEKLIKNNLTIATAESVTAGLIASNLCSIPNASKIFKGGIISYTNEIKEKLLNVNPLTIKKFGVISSQVANEMVIGVFNKFNTNISVSVTGVAGPNIVENKKKGTYFFSIILKNKLYQYEGSIKNEEIVMYLNKNQERKIYQYLIANSIIKQLFDLLIKNI